MCGSVAPFFGKLELLLNPYEEEFLEDEESPQQWDLDFDGLLIVMENTLPIMQTESERWWDVYRGLERPLNDADWLAISEFCRNDFFVATGVLLEHQEWQDAWEFLLNDDI